MPRYVNKNTYPLMLDDGRGGMVTLQPGQFTENPFYKKYVVSTMLTEEKDSFRPPAEKTDEVMAKKPVTPTLGSISRSTRVPLG